MTTFACPSTPILIFTKRNKQTKKRKEKKRKEKKRKENKQSSKIV